MSNIDVFNVPEYLCLDDLMNDVLTHLLRSNNEFKASKGDGAEMLGVSFRLLNPRARLSRSEMRGKVFSALGEFFWYLARSNRLDFIRHYITRYDDSSDDKKTVHGAYGPRIFGSDPSSTDQVRNVLRLLSKRPSSRRAAIQIFSADDLNEEHKDVPCTCTAQAIIRKDALNLFVYMRSNDAYWGLPHDIFVFTMLQEMLATALGVDVGFYQHMVGSLHLYDDKRDEANAYLTERYQTIEPMPPMPDGDPWPQVPSLVAAEAAIRTDPQATVDIQLSPYWSDIMRLVRVYSERTHRKPGYQQRIATLRKQMDSRRYDVYFPITTDD